MKARAGVTLVELLVVMLIAVILAVSLLPMFKEYICKAQYNAEAVPVIATLRTKISLYQYENSTLPPNITTSSSGASGSQHLIATWDIDTGAGGGNADTEKYVRAYTTFGSPTSPVPNPSGDKFTDMNKAPVNGDATLDPLHFASPKRVDINYQDLKGKRSRPYDYVYYKIPVLDAAGKEITTDSAYVVGCFGSGLGGFEAGTGYAVCELNLVSEGKKYIGTFERYKALEKNGTCPYLYFTDSYAGDSTDINGDTVYCPSEIDAALKDKGANDLPSVVIQMEAAGWKFTN